MDGGLYTCRNLVTKGPLGRPLQPVVQPISGYTTGHKNHPSTAQPVVGLVALSYSALWIYPYGHVRYDAWGK